MMKKILSVVLALFVIMMSTVAFAATTTAGTPNTSSSLSDVYAFKFQHKKKGIGKGLCPVYSAPYKSAYRAANGKASVATNSKMDISGYSENNWLLVRYETNNGSWRVGWIPAKYVKGVKTSIVLHFSHVEQVATKSIRVTDNNMDPYDASGYFATLDPGETYYVLGRYNYYGYDFWYIEFYIGSQVARGFIRIN